MGIRYQNIAACVILVLVMVMAEIAGICTNSSTLLHSPCLERERQALVKFKASLTDPSNLLSSWHGHDCCRWEGIGCDKVTGHVVMLDLTPPYLKCSRSMMEGEYWLRSDDEDNCDLLDEQYLEAGNVNSSLLELEYLTHLDLTGIYFYWNPIPMFVGSMRRLRYLSLSDAGFGGRIPSNLGNLINLHFLDLSENEFSPDSNINWISQLPFLEHLNMMHSFIYNEYQVNIINLTITAPNLHFLSLAGNGLSVSNLDALQNITSLVHLDLRWNNLASVPSWFGNFKKLEYLDLSGCGLHGPIPNAFQNATSIEFLDLSSNNFDFLPSWFHKFEKLKHLFFPSNNFKGEKSWPLLIPEMWYLNLSHNQISGSLPKHIGHIMPNLNNLILGNNLINGSIPKSLCQLDLHVLDLSKNRLSGKILNCWKDNGEWEEINLSSNKLSGDVPSSFGNLSTLSWLHLNNNSLRGEFLASMRNLPQLLIIDLGENQLSGTIPSWSANTFSSLQILRLRQNRLSGSIPSQICELSSIKILDLSRNNLNGSIPRCIGNLRGMTLEGPALSPNSSIAGGFALPPESDWQTEDVIEVIKGRELDYIRILKLVVIMDLSENNLVGSIPKGITLLNGLHSLNLSNNHLIGKIPNMIGDMRSLESFDVSSNQLSGTIPSSMLALTSLSHLYLSYNNFSGPIPTDNQFLTYDSSSYAGNPYLCGFPLPNKCGYLHEDHGSSEFEDDDSNLDKLEKWLFYLVIAIGFATGFWGVIGTLWFKKTWRHAYFRWVEDLADTIYVTTAIRMAKLKKWMMMRNRVVV
ncbi:Receptor-like protein [Arachis hypogaea]|nr:Receptor-like protein [Arachis hypogaea]